LTYNQNGDKLRVSIGKRGDKKLQDKLILLRKQKGVSQKSLADLLGITAKQFSVKELGKSKFNGDEMFKIADYFNVKIEDIFLPTTHQNGDIN
jgi:putative transcriptional regulator